MPQKRKLSVTSQDGQRPFHFEDQCYAIEDTDESHEETINVLTPSIFEQNTTKSILYRLPRELRDEIYAHVFNGLFLHVVDLGPERGTRYIPCQWFQSVNTLYEESLQGAPAKDPRWHHTQCPINGDITQFQPPLVCKQFWAEAEALYWKHTIFFFDKPSKALRWSHSSQLVSRIHRLALLATIGWDLEKASAFYRDFLPCEILDKYTKLEGVDLVLVRRFGNGRLPPDEAVTLPGCDYRGRMPLYSWLLPFSNRGFKEELTSVVVGVDHLGWFEGCGSDPNDKETRPEDRLRLAMLVKDVLLSCHKGRK